MGLLFGSGVERFLLVFVIEGKDTIPQHVFYDIYRLGRGTVTNAGKHLEQIGVIRRTRCWSDYKQDKVVCYSLTDKGRVVVECLRKAYDALGLKPVLLGGD